MMTGRATRNIVNDLMPRVTAAGEGDVRQKVMRWERRGVWRTW